MMQEKEAGKKRIDWMLLLIVAVLIVLGLIMQYSASSYDLSLVKRQGIYALAGIVIMFVIRIIPVWFLEKVSVLGFAVSLALTAVTFFRGKVVKGASRWLVLGPLTFQPSELLKITLIMVMAAVICRRINDIQNTDDIRMSSVFRGEPRLKLSEYLTAKKGYLLMILCTLLATADVAVATKDLGTAIIVFGIGIVIMLVISPRIKYIIAIMVGAAMAAGGLVALFPYRRGRITAWLHLEENTTDLGYQIKEGLYAIGSGGWFGKGLGRSIQKDIIPEPHTDMIFSIVCEELGIIGGIVILVLFIMLILRLKNIYEGIRDLYGKIIVAGVAAHLTLQTFVNIAVLTNLIPNTGVPLPFFSYGGTALVCILMEIGLVLAVSRPSKETVKITERESEA